MIESVMAIDLPPFDDLHRFIVLFSSGVIGESGIAASHLDVAVAQKILKTLQRHAAIEHFRSKGMAQAVQTIGFMR